MSSTLSPTTGKPYGVARVCRIWRMGRASVYRHRHPEPSVRQRPGPAGPMPDQALVEQDPCRPFRKPLPWRRPSEDLGPAADRRYSHLAPPCAAADARTACSRPAASASLADLATMMAPSSLTPSTRCGGPI
jgi:hypothetical protein